MNLAAFFTVHRDLPREAPGSDEATREAIRRLPRLPASPRILDLGCGPGQQTLVLARELGVSVTAVDLHEPFLDRLRQSAAAEGLSDRVITRQTDMASLDEPPGSIDLIWAEGSIYILGFGNGLQLWRPLLRDEGLMVVSECTWIKDNPPAAVVEFWREEYPAMTTVEENAKTATEAGYDVFDRFSLPRSGWENYYQPLRDRVSELREEGRTDPELMQVLDATDREIEMCDRYGDYYSYVFYLMRKIG